MSISDPTGLIFDLQVEVDRLTFEAAIRTTPMEGEAEESAACGDCGWSGCGGGQSCPMFGL
jgi:hypothetical protein